MSAQAIFFLDENDTYNGPEPYFYDTSKVAGVKILEDNWHIIRDEMQDILSGKKDITLDIPYPPYLSRPDSWKIIYFFNFMWQYHQNCKLFPKTCALLKSVPGLTFAAVTALDPHAKVLPHIGETNATMRGHLGLVIPAPYPTAGIKVGNEERGWEEGKAVLFSDSHWHTAWNDSDKRRFVLVFDIMRPEFAKHRYWMSAQGLSAITIKLANQKWGLFNHFPQFLQKAVHQLFAVIWYVYLPLQRTFGLP